MEKFEIHVTGSPDIIDVLADLGYKSLHAEMRNPVNENIGVEYMSSFVREFEDFESCRTWTTIFAAALSTLGVNVVRVKIECPYTYEHYRDKAIYVEAHFPTDRSNPTYPFVYNVRSKKLVSTDRVSDRELFDESVERWKSVGITEIELCLYDDNVEHDSEWIKSFEKRIITL